jgi:uncharacterized protein YacL
MRREIASRAIGTIALMFVGWQVGSIVGTGSSQPWNAGLGLAAGAVVGVVLAPYIVARPYQALRRFVSRMPIGEFLFAVAGFILGLLAGALFAYPLSFLPWWFGHFLPAAVTIVCAYLGVALMTMRRRELVAFFSGRFGEHPEDDTISQNGARYLIDTSAIIDGRIADISQAGFLRGCLVVPRFVLRELQNIAGSSDPLRRNRGRRGLEVLNRMQKDAGSEVNITDADVGDVSDVDGKLVQLARRLSCPVITNDFGLNRIAELQGVVVLNINQLAQAVKPVVLPGEEMAVHIIQEGKELNQGVGYLDDGTMIVVENGRQYLQNEIEIVVTRVLQTVAGRMIFAQPKNNGLE